MTAQVASAKNNYVAGHSQRGFSKYEFRATYETLHLNLGDK